MTKQVSTTAALLRFKEALVFTGLSKTAFYNKQNAREGNPYFDPTFPRPVQLSGHHGGRSVAWVRSELEEWIAKRIEERDSSVNCASASHRSPPDQTKSLLIRDKDGIYALAGTTQSLLEPSCKKRQGIHSKTIQAHQR